MPNSVIPRVNISESDIPPQSEDIPPKSGTQASENTTEQNVANLKTKAEISDIDNTRQLKTEIASYACKLATSSIIIWFTLIVTHIITSLWGYHIFSDNLFIAITTGCTVNILAVLLAVTKGLFK